MTLTECGMAVLSQHGQNRLGDSGGILVIECPALEPRQLDFKYSTCISCCLLDPPRNGILDSGAISTATHYLHEIVQRARPISRSEFLRSAANRCSDCLPGRNKEQGRFEQR